MKAKRKKALKAIIAAISLLLCAAVIFSSFVLYRFNCDKSGSVNSYGDIYNKAPVALNVGGSGIFKVLKINDTHFFNGTCENDAKTLDGINRVISENKYDLIVVDGDLVDGFNLKADYDKYKAIDIFAKSVEKYNIPWTFAPGNNDGEIDGENEDIIAYMMQYEHFICANTKGVDGSMNLFIDLNFSGKLVHSIAVMDSLARTVKAIGKYDYIKENQAKWLLDGVEKRNVKTSVFFHMQTNEFQKAYDNGEAYKGYVMSDAFPYDDIENDSVFDEAIGDNENISLISCAHQHSNNMCSFYNGRYYQLSNASGYSAIGHEYIGPSLTEISINVTDENTKTMYSFNQIKI